MKLCVFQGTFNPIHTAHLKMAKYIADNFLFNKILFIPAGKPPHKMYEEEMSVHRLNMVKIATQEDGRFKCCDIEYNLKGVSYTYNTILELYKQFSIDDKIYFIIGTDAFEKIESWYEIDKLKTLVKFLIFKRAENFDNSKFDYLRDKNFDFEFVNMNFEDISSTELRNKIKNNEDYSQFVTKKEKDYIEKNGLYKN